VGKGEEDVIYFPPLSLSLLPQKLGRREGVLINFQDYSTIPPPREGGRRPDEGIK
jgi:hypothetical protein